MTKMNKTFRLSSGAEDK